jgi:hypothetical protein
MAGGRKDKTPCPLPLEEGQWQWLEEGRFFMKCAILFLWLLFLTAVSTTSDEPVVVAVDKAIDTRPVTGVYTNLYHDRSGINGIEMLVLFADKTPYVVMQIAKQKTSVPFIMQARIIRQEAPALAILEFDVPKDKGQWGHFHGLLDGMNLKGTFDGSHVVVNLPRQRSYWQQ